MPSTTRISLVFATASLAGLLAAAACSADSGAGGGGSSGGGGGGSGGAGAGGTSGSGGIGVGGTGGIGVGAAGSGGGGGGVTDACAMVGEKAENKLQPADIVFALDNSGSMDEEAAFVQQHMNTFSTVIVGQNIDAHVVILSANSTQSNGVCIGPPLGSGQCPNDDTAIFLHLDVPVASTNALQLFLSEFPNYASMLRPGASKHFVVVTDDDSDLPAASFDQQIKPLLMGVDPQFQSYYFHGVYAWTDPLPFTCLFNVNADDCCDKGTPGDVYTANIGTVYEQLVGMTGGVKGNLCLQDFQFVFNAVSQQVVQGSKLACEWDLPTPDGGTLDPTKVNVDFSPPGGPSQSLGNVPSAAECAQYAGGWYYDNPTNPTKIYVCPETCAVIQGIDGAEIKILFGCDTIPATPR